MTLKAPARSRVDAALNARFSGAGERVATQSPLELRGPFRRGGLPVYFLRNVTAGVFAGDSYRVELTAEAGAAVRVASSSAAKVHEMPEGNASVDVTLRAKNGSTLAWGVHPTILQGGSDLRQRLDLSLDSGARVVVAEVLAFGRLARGEIYEFRRYRSELAVRVDGRLSYEEQYVITPGSALKESLGGHGVLVSVLGLGVTDDASRGRLWDALEGESKAGVTTLPNHSGLIVRGLATSLSEGCGLAERCLLAFEV